MNSLLDYIYLAEYIAPVVSALSCTVLLLLSYGNSHTHIEIRIKRIAVLYLCSSLFSWTASLIYVFFPEYFVYIQSLGYLTFLLVQVLFYRLFHILTASGDRERFSPWHYLVPLVICTTLAVWSLFVPYDVQLDITLGRGKVIPGGYEAYTRLFLTKLPARVIYCVFYISLTFVRLAKYYKKANTSPSLVRRPARWVLLLVALTIMSVVISTIALLVRSSGLYLSLVMTIASLAAMAQHIVPTFTILRRSYLLYIAFPDEERPKIKPQAALPVGEKDGNKKRKSYVRGSAELLTRDGFDDWFGEHKPWLDPAFKITDLVEATGVNRTYLSKFVNHTYGVNFNRYVNRLRLHELDRLTGLAPNKDKPLDKLARAAGFVDAKHYQRALAAENAPPHNDKL